MREGLGRRHEPTARSAGGADQPGVRELQHVCSRPVVGRERHPPETRHLFCHDCSLSRCTQVKRLPAVVRGAIHDLTAFLPVHYRQSWTDPGLPRGRSGHSSWNWLFLIVHVSRESQMYRSANRYGRPCLLIASRAGRVLLCHVVISPVVSGPACSRARRRSCSPSQLRLA